jgi:hypothetical protein
MGLTSSMALRVLAAFPVMAASGFALLSLGCLQLPPSSTVATSLPGPGTHEASVVFVRPVSACDTADYLVISDSHGRFVGNVAPGTKVAIAVAPGQHTFYGWNNLDLRFGTEPNFNPATAERVNAVEGQTYYVALVAFRPCHQARSISEMALVAPGGGLWGDVQDWLKSTTPIQVDRQAGQAALDARPALLQTYLELGEWKLRRLDDERARKERYEAILAEEH